MKLNLKSFFIYLFATIAIPTYAQWTNVTTLNNLITNASAATAKSSLVATSDGQGGQILAWIDSREAASKTIYAQRILADGSLKFSSEVIVSNAAGATSSSKANLAIIADSAGGAICVWQDSRNTTATLNSTDLYGQRIDGNGNVLWAKDGVRLTLTDNTVSNKINALPVMATKNDLFFIFGDNKAGSSDLYAQKIDLSTGATLWATEPSLHGAQPNVQSVPLALADGVGGVVVIWQDPRKNTADADIYAQRIDNTGKILWDANGLPICTEANQQLTPQIVSDGSGGYVITWSDQRAAVANGNIYAQRINQNGIASWAVNGVLICDFTGNQSNPYIVKSGNGFIIAWSDQRNGTSDRNIYAQRIDTNGNPLWTSVTGGGNAIVTATGNQPGSAVNTGIKLLGDGKEGVYVIWDDGRLTSSNYDIYAARLDSTGAFVNGWAANGNVVANAANNQTSPNVTIDIENNIIISWRDARNAGSEIYASKLQPLGILVLPFAFINTGVQQASGMLRINWTAGNETNIASYILEKSVDGKRFSEWTKLAAKGSRQYSFSVANSIVTESYFRIVAINMAGNKTYSPILSIASLKSASALVYPNPYKNNFSVRISDLNTESVSLSIYSTSGQRLFVKQFRVQAGQNNLSVDGLGIATGTYHLVVTDNQNNTILKQTIIKQ